MSMADYGRAIRLLLIGAVLISVTLLLASVAEAQETDTPVPTWTPVIPGPTPTRFVPTPYDSANPGSASSAKPCPGPDAVGVGTPWPNPDDLAPVYSAQCSHCFMSTSTPNPYQISTPEGTPVDPGDVVPGDPIDDDRQEDGVTAILSSGGQWSMITPDIDVPDSVKYWVNSDTSKSWGQSIAVGPYNDPVVGLMLDVSTSDKGSLGTLVGWATSAQDGKWYQGQSFFPSDSPIVRSDNPMLPGSVCIGPWEACETINAGGALHIPWDKTISAGQAFSIAFYVQSVAGMTIADDFTLSNVTPLFASASGSDNGGTNGYGRSCNYLVF